MKKLKAKVLSVPLLPVPSLPSRGSSIAPILAPIGRVRQSYIIATFTFLLRFSNEHACIRAYSYCSVRSTTAPTWLIPSVLERLRDGLLHLRLQQSLPSHPNRCGEWKSPAYEPKHFATSKTSVWLHLGPRRHQPQSQQARNDLTPPSLETRRPLPAMLETAFPAATMASLLPPTMAFEPRANFKNMSSTTSVK